MNARALNRESLNSEPLHEAPPLLQVEAVTKRFGGLWALSGCSFVVPEGSILGVIGPNGAGKTTLFNVIAGALRPSEGRVLFRGRDITGLPPERVAALGIGRTFQIPRVFKRMTVWENLIAVGRKGRAHHELARTLLERAGMSDHALEYAGNLGYGHQKMLELLRVLMLEPSLILLDEPAAGVNPTERERMMALVMELHQEGYTFLVIEHHMDVVSRYCNRVIVLNFGEKIAEGTYEEIRRNEQVLAAYFGS